MVVFTIASFVALHGFLQGRVLYMLLLPFCYWWGPSAFMHDGGHFTLSKHPLVNRVCARLGAAHSSLLTWQHQHTIGHHEHTNIAGSDPDLYHYCLFAGPSLLRGVPGFRTTVEYRPITTAATMPPDQMHDTTATTTTIATTITTGHAPGKSQWWGAGLGLRAPLACHRRACFPCSGMHAPSLLHHGDHSPTTTRATPVRMLLGKALPRSASSATSFGQ